MTYLKKTSNIIPLIILLTGSIITISLFIHFKDLYKENENEILTRISRETEKIIMSRLKTYEDIHYAGGALYHAFGDVKYEQWKKWVEANKLLSVYPGIRGIGIAVPVNKKDSLSFLREMKAEIPDYKISSFGEIENEPVRFIIKYIEPTWANSAALGVDMGSEKERRLQMIKAILTGTTTMTGKVAIVQDIERRPAFLMYVPIYNTSALPLPENRTKEFRCWIYSAFVMNEFMDGLLKEELKNLLPFMSFKILSSKNDGQTELLYSYKNTSKSVNTNSLTRTVNIYGQKWILICTGNEELSKLIVTKQPLIILITGFLLSIALSWLVYSLINKKSEAEKMARSMTRELSDLNHFYESLIQSMNEGLLVLDEEFKITKANNRFYTLFRKDHTVDGKLIAELTNPKWTEVHNDLQQAFGQRLLFEKEYEFEFKNGERKVFLITHCPITMLGESDIKVLLVITDITDKKENEERRNDFIGFVSHELRTPLTNLKAYSQLAERYIKEKKYDETYLINQKIETFIETLNILVSELHDLTKITVGKFQVHKKPFTYDEFIEEIINNASVAYPNFKFIKEGEPAGEINADRFRIGQVLNNYISNAVKYSSEKNEIIIRVIKDKNELITSVRDFGIGLSEQQCVHVFERLYRVPESGSIEGLGLGLFLSKEIIKAHYGKVWVKSQLGEGSEFFYCLPLNSSDTKE